MSALKTKLFAAPKETYNATGANRHLQKCCNDAKLGRLAAALAKPIMKRYLNNAADASHHIIRIVGSASQKPRTAKQLHAVFSGGQQVGHFLPAV